MNHSRLQQSVFSLLADATGAMQENGERKTAVAFTDEMPGSMEFIELADKCNAWKIPISVVLEYYRVIRKTIIDSLNKLAANGMTFTPGLQVTEVLFAAMDVQIEATRLVIETAGFEEDEKQGRLQGCDQLRALSKAVPGLLKAMISAAGRDAEIIVMRNAVGRDVQDLM